MRAQVSYPEHPRYTVERLAGQYGLGAVTVTAMGQDRQGYLWVGTQTGLYRYDGARAEKMTEVEGLVGHYIVDLVIAPDGTPWFAGNRGVAHYKNDQFESLAIPASASAAAMGRKSSKDVPASEMLPSLTNQHPPWTRIATGNGPSRDGMGSSTNCRGASP